MADTDGLASSLARPWKKGERFQCLVCCCLSSLDIIKDRNWERHHQHGTKLDISSYHKRKPDDGMKMERPNFGGGGVQVVLFIPWNLQLAIIIQVVIMRSTQPWCFRLCSRCLWKALDEEGCMGLVPWCLDLWCKSSSILNNFLTENKIKSWLKT
jgi:hypothetical protein